MKPSIPMRKVERMQKYPAIKWGDNNHVLGNNRKPVYFGQVDGNHKGSSTNPISPLFLKSDIKVENDDQKIVRVEPIAAEKIADCELTDTQEVENQSATAIDIFKEEWTLDELLDLNITEIPYLVENLIPCDSSVIIAGPSDVGKSTLYTQLAIAIVKGEKEFLGFKLNPVHRRVLIVSTEDGPIPLAFRTKKQTSNENLSKIIRKNLKVFFTYDNLEKRICNYLENNPVDLVVIDAFSDVYQGDINASNGVRQFLNRFTIIIQKYRCSVLFVHHVCKGKKKGQSEKDQLLGSTGIVGKVRSVMMLSNNSQQHHLNVAKGNYLSNEDKGEITYLSFNPSILKFSKSVDYQLKEKSEEGNITSGSGSSSKSRPGRQKDMSLYNQAIKLYNEGMKQVEIAKIVGRDKATICKWIKADKNRKPYDFSKVEDDEE
jgi:archaellum biogenesis ATPase FlaH